MPESSQPFAASHDHSNLDITHDSAIADDDLPELAAEEITDVDLHFGDDDAPPMPFEPPEPTLPMAPVALARVSFNELATLSFDGYQETFQVTLLNLSTQGVACLGPRGLNVADTVRLTFALVAGEEPASLLCEVMWSQPSTPREDAYGLRFTAVQEHLLAQVEDVVRQRCDSAAAACQIDGMQAPTIMATTVSAPALATPSMAPWVVAAAGAAAGMLVTLAVMVLVESELFTEPARQASAPPPATAVVPAAAIPEVMLPADLGVLAPLAPLVQPAAPPPAVTEPSNRLPSQTADAAQLAPVEAPKAVAAPAPKAVAVPPAKAGALPAKVRFVGDLQVEEAPRTVALTLRTNGPAALHEEFWLSNPTRLVVDIPAARNGMRGRHFDVANPLVARVRVGEHADKVRFVIETNKNVSSVVRAKVSGDALRIELRQHS